MFSPEPRILYVENHDDTRQMIEIMLEYNGYRVTAVNDDKLCLEHLMKNSFDLILLEHTRFAISGTGLCRTIREFDKQTPILFFSSRANPREAAAALAAGAQSYLIKPNDLSRLTQEVARLIGTCERPRHFFSRLKLRRAFINRRSAAQVI